MRGSVLECGGSPPLWLWRVAKSAAKALAQSKTRARTDCSYMRPIQEFST